VAPEFEVSHLDNLSLH